MRQRFRLAALASASVAAAAAHAQIPSTAPFFTDPQNVYVQDDTSQGIGNLNMVLCVIGSLDPGDMVNAGPYIALVDINRCQNKGGGSNSSATGATNYATAVVTVTRASNSDPMVGKVWMSFTEQGNTRNVFAYLSATQSPTDAPPYGAFRMDYIGKMGSNTGFNGYVVAQAGTISFLETGQQSSNTALAMSASSTTSGAGSMSINSNGNGGSPANFNFAYNSSYFRRSDGTNDECFDRSKANAAVSVWQYGTYKASDGTRVDQANPGFPILASYRSQSYYGFANYWGINFQGLDLNSIADASPIAGLSVTDQRQGNTTAYNLSKVGGKLTKWTQAQTTLAALDGVPFTFGADLTNQSSNSALVSGWNNWIGQWGQNGVLTVTGTQSCGSNGCVPVSFAGNATATVNAAFLATNPVMGWSDSLGGNLNIPATGSTHVGTDPVYYYTQATVIPGSSGEPTSLYCLSQCPTAAALSAFPAGGSSASPFGNGTAQQWFSAPSAGNTVTYAFGATGLLESSTSMVLEQSSQYPSGSMYAQNGIMTGRLFDSPLSAANCPSGSLSGTVCEPANPAYYFTWQTGPNQWSQSLWLTRASDNSVVALDPPQNVPYTVPTGAAYGTFAGKTILLQFNGFGNLFGIPGSCVDPVTNAAVNCGPNARYVPSFSIPDWTSGNPPTLAATAATPAMIVKALNAEVRLQNLGASGSSPCSSMTLSAMTLPSGGLHDPSNSGDSEYLGTMPTVSGAPKVIDGVVQ